MVSIAPGLHAFQRRLLGRAYLLIDEDGYTLIDVGLRRSAGSIFSDMARSGLDPGRIRRIAITHAHPDHIGALDDLVSRTGAAVYAGRGEQPVIEGRAAMVVLAAGRQARLALPAGLFSHCGVDVPLDDGDPVPALGGLQTIATPGHTPGHVSFWQPERRILFSGDCIIRFPRMRLPFGAFTADVQENRRSVTRLGRLNPEIICFGHGAPLRIRAADSLRAFVQAHGAAPGG